MSWTNNKLSNSTISVVIHTYNEEKNIESCIASARKLTNKIIVVDMQSTDKTIDLAKKMGAEVHTFPYSSYVEPAREFGIEKADTEWVSLLDADERMTRELAEEIQKTIVFKSHSGLSRIDSGVASLPRMTPTHYKIPRKNIFGQTKWLKYGGWWPDYQVRLINKKYFKSWPREIHSTPIISGNMGYLKNPITHYFHGDIESMVEKTIIFEDIESDLLFKAGKEVKTATFFRKFLGELYRRLIRSFGFLDGEIGIIESIYQAFSKTTTYLYLYEKNRSLRSLS